MPRTLDKHRSIITKEMSVVPGHQGFDEFLFTIRQESKKRSQRIANPDLTWI